MIKQILKMGGCKTEKEFYKKYPTEESFLEAFPQAQRMIEQYKIGGQSDKSLTPAAFPQAPVADRFFNYGMPAMNIPRPMQEGGQSQQIKNTPILEMIKAIAEYNEMEEADVIQTLQENVPAEQLQMLTDQALSDPETVAKTLNQYIQQLTGSDEQQQMESQYLEGQPLMQDMLAQQAMAQEADQEAMPMDPNMAMQMAYGGSKLRRFIPKHQTKGPVQNQQPPAEEDSFWDSTLGTVSKYGIGVGTGLIGQEIMIRLATSEVVRDALGYTKEKWKNMKVGERLKMIGKSIKKGGLGAGKRYAIGPLVGFALVGIGEALDSPEVESAPSNLKPKSPPAPGASNAFSNPTLVDSSDKDRIPVMMQNAPQSVDSLKAVQQQMIMNKAKKKQSGGIPSSNYGQFTVPMKKGGQSAPMGMSSNDDVTSNRLETLRKFVTDNVYDNMVKEEGEEIMTAYMPQNTMMQEDVEQEYMLYGGRLKKKGRTDERLRMALQGRLDYMQPGGQSDGLTSAFGFVSSPVGSMFDRRTAPTIDGPAPSMSTVGPVQGQGTAINLGGYSNMSQPSGAYNTYAPQSNATTEGIMNMAQNQNKALDQYQTVEGSGKQCPPGYKWDPKRGECVVAQTRAGKALDKMGEWWQNKSGDERANMVLGAANSIVGAKEQMNQRKYEEQLEKQMFNKFTTSVTAPTDKGMHMVNQRTPVPPTMMTPVQFTGQNYTQGYGYAQMGGELYLSDDEIQNIISMGGEVEYLD